MIYVCCMYFVSISITVMLVVVVVVFFLLYEPRQVKTNKMACASSEDSDQPGHPPSLIRVFAVRMKKPCCP